MKTTKTWLVIPALCIPLLFATAATADSADLEGALDHLQAARNALERGERKGAHRRDALQSVSQAIEHVRLGLDEERRRERKAEKQEERREEKAVRQDQRQEDKAVRQGQRREDQAEKKAAREEKKTGN